VGDFFDLGNLVRIDKKGRGLVSLRKKRETLDNASKEDGRSGPKQRGRMVSEEKKRGRLPKRGWEKKPIMNPDQRGALVGGDRKKGKRKRGRIAAGPTGQRRHATHGARKKEEKPSALVSGGEKREKQGREGLTPA